MLISYLGGFARKIVAATRDIVAVAGHALPVLALANAPAAQALNAAVDSAELRRRDPIESFLRHHPVCGHRWRYGARSCHTHDPRARPSCGARKVIAQRVLVIGCERPPMLRDAV